MTGCERTVSTDAAAVSDAGVCVYSLTNFLPFWPWPSIPSGGGCGFLRRWRRHQSRLLPVWLWLCAGANAAAAEKDVQVEMNYSWEYGSSFSASPELQTMANGWYQSGTEVIFACGGSMFQSIAAAASANDGYVIGVDVDQSGESTTVITSAMKGLADSAQWALGKFYAGEFASIGGVQTSLGANENAVGLPTATWSLTKWSVDSYKVMLQDIKDGKIASAGILTVGNDPLYSKFAWPTPAEDNEIAVLHLYGVHPSFRRQGLSSVLLTYQDQAKSSAVNPSAWTAWMATFLLAASMKRMAGALSAKKLSTTTTSATARSTCLN